MNKLKFDLKSGVYDRTSKTYKNGEQDMID